MSDKYIKLKLEESCEELACDCQDAWEFEYGCPVRNIFKCPFYGEERQCYTVTKEMWEALIVKDEDEK